MSSIGAGLLGFVQGASSGAGAAAAQQVQSDIDLERKLSLEQTLAQRKNERNKQLFADVFENSPSLQDRFDSAEDFQSMAGTEAGQFALGLEQEEAENKREAQEERDRIANRKALAIQAGADKKTADAFGKSDANFSDLDTFIKSGSKGLGAETASEISKSTGISTGVVQELAERDMLKSSMINALKQDDDEQDFEFYTTIDTATGEVQQYSKEQLGQALRDNPNLEVGERQRVGDEFVVVSDNMVVPVGGEPEEAEEQLTQRQEIREQTRNLQRTSPEFKETNLDRVLFSKLQGKDFLGATTGPVDAAVETIGRLTPFTEFGATQIAGTTRLAALFNVGRNAFGASGTKPVKALLDNLKIQLPTPSGIEKLQQDKTVVQPVRQLLDSIDAFREQATQLMKRSDDPAVVNDAEAKIIEMEQLEAEVQTLLAEREIANMDVPLQTGGSKALSDMTSMEELEQIDLDKFGNFFGEGSGRAAALTLLWTRKVKHDSLDPSNN